MNRSLRLPVAGLCCFAGLLLGCVDRISAQPPRPGADANAPAAAPLIIQRDAIHLMSPSEFTRPISLKPTRQLVIRALVEGIVQNVRVQPGAKVSGREELVRIESSKAGKMLERAKANLKVATLRRDLAKAQTGDQAQASRDLAEAELQVAEADLDLAQLDADNTSVRAPFAGEVLSVEAVEGAFVNEGDALLELRDPAELSVRLPVDRTKVKQGDSIQVQLDQGTAQGKIQTLLPLTEEWQSLRQLIDTAAIAVVVIDNKDGQYQDGQTAYSTIVPRMPVVEVANGVLKNSETGSRIVQVLRDHIVRDIEVNLLGAVGEGRSFISGAFQQGDELIVTSSLPLVAGTVVLPANPATPEPKATTPTRPALPPGTPGI